MKRDLKSMLRKKEVNEDKEKIEDVRKKAEELSKLSEGELMGELYKSVNAAKESGDFNDEQINSFLNTVSPMLSGDQLGRMKELIEKLK